MEVIPAVDLRDGRCVRLYQGDYAQETVYSDDPVQVALDWQSMGAPRVHLVDLDGAASGEIHNLEAIKLIATALQVPVELGGGIRDLATIERLLKMGVDRVILGTAAVRDQQLVKEACRRYQQSIAVGIDTRGGWVTIQGWQQETRLHAIELAKSMYKFGVRRFIYTDILRDGTLTEPNFSAFSELLDAVKVPVIASGGISSINHLRMLKSLGAEGAIIGKALYTGDIRLKEALAAIDT